MKPSPPESEAFMEKFAVPADLTRPALLDDLGAIASQAAVAIMRVRAGGATARSKADASPVTEADEAAEAIILEGLARVLPGMAVVSEEAAAQIETTHVPDTFILVDPLDGTREFIAGRDEFTVNIAIVHDGRPVSGIVGIPAPNGCNLPAARIRKMPGPVSPFGPRRIKATLGAPW
jgi:3'-phosphoadenosine 5'-phosphosulfate (PAPS) 3'-phosphatase